MGGSSNGGLSGSHRSLGDLTLADRYLQGSETLYGESHPTRAPVRAARRIVVKVGTAVVTRQDQRLAVGRLGSLVEQIEALVSKGRHVILVTSGAVSVGRQKLFHQQVFNSSPLMMQANSHASNKIHNRAAAAAGQSGLMALYDQHFALMDLQAAQVLVTPRDFRDPAFLASLRETTEELLGMARVVPVFNENDAISDRGGEGAHGFKDNDSLAAELARELNADLLVLLTNVDGLLDGPPGHKGSKVVPTYTPETWDSINFGPASSVGRGGMQAKVGSAWAAAQSGIPTVIANGKKLDALLRVVEGVQEGTLFDLKAAAQEKRAITTFLEYGQQANHGVKCGTISEAEEGSSARAQANAARAASRLLCTLPTEVRECILTRLADALEREQGPIMAANSADVAAAEKGKLDPVLLQRLKLSPEKLQNLAAGIRSIAASEEPIGKVRAHRELAAGLDLEQVSVPIGVLLIIFESRPDALPQIAALAIRSGNGLLLKGGKEAARSNAALHRLVVAAIEAEAPKAGPALVQLLEGRQAVADLLHLDDAIDLVIPRGSNALVSGIKAATNITVMGHAEGVCHIYLDKDCEIQGACRLVVDSKTDYPSACNAVEKVLVHAALLGPQLYKLQAALSKAGVRVYGGERAVAEMGLEPAPALKHEYGANALTLELVDSLQEAIDHIHAHGSSHTECIATENAETAEAFLRSVDAACVFHNASTRFADGYRFGLGAEVGISTGRIHARGPVGVEGLLTQKWLLRGHGQVVAKDTGITYTHKELPLGPLQNGVHGSPAGLPQGTPATPVKGLDTPARAEGAKKPALAA